jgi:hypothetical protein
VQVIALGDGQSVLPLHALVHSILVIMAKGSHIPEAQSAAPVHAWHRPPPPPSPPLLEPELPLLEPELPLLEPELPLLEPELPLLEPDASSWEPPSSPVPEPLLLLHAMITAAPIAPKTMPAPALLAMVSSDRSAYRRPRQHVVTAGRRIATRV